MAIVLPFKCVRPSKDKAKECSSVPYDVIGKKEAKEVVKKNPLSFLKITRSEVDFEDSVNPYSEKVYKRAKENFQNALKDKTLLIDSDIAYYVYQIKEGSITQTGIVALSSVNDYNSSLIKIHEKTRPEKENDRITHIETLNANIEPVFLIYKKNIEISRIIEEVKTSSSPLYSFKAKDLSTHLVWKISDIEKIEEIKNLFSEIPNTYIADGHHRAKAASCVLKRDKTNKNKELFLTVLFPDTEVNILPYNRIIKDINISPSNLIEKLSKEFNITKDVNPVPSESYLCTLYLKDKTWYGLSFKTPKETNSVVESLDISLIEKHILKPIFKIEDQRTDKKIDFIGGSKGYKHLENLINLNKADVAIYTHPITVKDLVEVADNNLLMPPKSTWFSPKLRSGLFVYKF